MFTDGGNDAVVCLPNRSFPGVLIQGAPLSILRDSVTEVIELCAAGDPEEARYVTSLLHTDL